MSGPVRVNLMRCAALLTAAMLTACAADSSDPLAGTTISNVTPADRTYDLDLPLHHGPYMLRQAEKNIELGDAAIESQQYALAMSYYDKARHLVPTLGLRDSYKEIYEKLKYQAPVDEARSRMAIGDYEAAIPLIKKSISINDQYDPAWTALDEAYRGAAQNRYENALLFAEHQQLDHAAASLEKAIEFDASNEAAAAALRSIRSPEPDPATRQLLDKAEALAEQKDWEQAATWYWQATQQSPNDLRARAALNHANMQIEESKLRVRTANELRKAGQLEDAIEILEEALAIWPQNQDVTPLLTELRQQVDNAAEHYRKALAHADESEWDEAIEAAKEALAVYRGHYGARMLIARVRQDAADTLTVAGDAHLMADEWADAFRAYKRALTYDVNHRAAAGGIAALASLNDERAGAIPAQAEAIERRMERNTAEEDEPRMTTAEQVLRARLSRIKLHTDALQDELRRRRAADRPPDRLQLRSPSASDLAAIREASRLRSRLAEAQRDYNTALDRTIRNTPRPEPGAEPTRDADFGRTSFTTQHTKGYGYTSPRYIPSGVTPYAPDERRTSTDQFGKVSRQYDPATQARERDRIRERLNRIERDR